MKKGAVDLFKPRAVGPQEAQEGEFVKDLGAGKGVKLEEPNGVAVNAATGTVYVADSVKGTIDEFSDAGRARKRSSRVRVRRWAPSLAGKKPKVT